MLWTQKLEDNNVMDSGATNLNSGDKLILSAGNDRRVWTVSAVNNQVVKYFDENGLHILMTFGQRFRSHPAKGSDDTRPTITTTSGQGI